MKDKSFIQQVCVCALLDNKLDMRKSSAEMREIMNEILKKKEGDTPKTMKSFIASICKSDVRMRLIPTELVAGWPSISVKKKELCVTLPFYAFRRNSEGTGNLLYPLGYLITATWRNNRIIAYSCLLFDKNYKDVDFNKPCGSFKHEAIKNMTKGEYSEQRDRLYQYYDEMIESLSKQESFAHEKEMKEVFQKLMEPGQYPMYLKVAPKFFSYYCGLDM